MIADEPETFITPGINCFTLFFSEIVFFSALLLFHVSFIKIQTHKAFQILQNETFKVLVRVAGYIFYLKVSESTIAFLAFFFFKGLFLLFLIRCLSVCLCVSMCT